MTDTVAGGVTDRPTADETQTVFEANEGEQVRDVAIGSRLGRYVVVEGIGEGAMGKVVRAYDPRLRREVALKLLRIGSSEARARMQREAQAMAQLSHPNIVAVFDVDVHEGQPFIAMEYVVGTTLAVWMRERVRPWPEIVEAFVAAGRGLAAAHRSGIVHRDFKPTNVLVAAGDELGTRVRVMDFGLARASEVPVSDSERAVPAIGDDALTQIGTVMGTPAYMAPEQHAGLPTDARCDQYAFCVALWEALAGVRPFAAKELVKAKWTLTIDEPPEARPIPRHLRRLLLRGLARQPEDRFASMDALLEELRRDPRQRRRVMIGSAVVALAIGGWIGARWWQHQAAMHACDEAGQAIAEVWSPAIATRVRDALVATGNAQAETTAERVTPWLDDYATQWRARRTAVCKDELAVDARTRVIDCLDERRASLRALVDELTEADASVVGRAVMSAVGLPALVGCDDAAALARTPMPDPAVREEVAELRQAIASVGAQAAIGRYDIATTRSDEILARAEAIGFPPLLAQAKISVANVTSRRGDPARARPLLEEAYFLAAVAGADDVAAVATLRLVAVVGNDLGEPLTALLWGRIGLGHLERIGAGEDLRTAGILQNLGNVLDAEGRFEDALANYQRSLAIREAALGPDHPDLASSYTSIGLVYGSMRREEEARAALERAIALWTETFGPDHLAIAGALSTMSGIDHRMGNLAAAREDMERAIAIQERVDGPDHPEVASSLGNLAIVVQAQGDLDGAEKLYQRAKTIAETRLGPDHPELAYPLDGLGSIALARGDAKTALAYHRRAVALGEKAYGPEHVQIVSSLRNLGLAQTGVGDRPAAIATLERALAISEAHGRDDIDLSRTRYALALAVHPDDPARALTLAGQAREVFAAHEHGDGPLTREVDAQLDAWRR